MHPSTVHKGMPSNDFDPNAWLTMQAAAGVLKTSRYQIQRRALLGEFEMHLIKETGVILLSKASVDAALERGDVGPPRRKKKRR